MIGLRGLSSINRVLDEKLLRHEDLFGLIASCDVAPNKAIEADAKRPRGSSPSR